MLTALCSCIGTSACGNHQSEYSVPLKNSIPARLRFYLFIYFNQTLKEQWPLQRDPTSHFGLPSLAIQMSNRSQHNGLSVSIVHAFAEHGGRKGLKKNPVTGEVQLS